ncbi:ATP-dependent protease LonB [Alkaliphilus oremlandii]|uniref:endopeptidase La n=1 Tax=Alkaliphilus oremlandii (strain OhILAs) TaxID=350688 RepID=A8MIS6_ALKOO|nr:ATP-dependent protease LonB [Alkaliphilus oremlandii]ABW19708.1 Sporulation protease LonB [Alkaliphilus oremlandii OhILAs]
MSHIFFIVQFFFAVVIGLYFLSLLKNQQVSKIAMERESKKEIDRLREMRENALTTPLSESVRPSTIEDIIGQEDGIKALRAALCTNNPQHVIIYGPPGVGKTAAARVILEEAKRNHQSPFNFSSKFIEIDATTLRFDERGIADPLMGSVHDPIYQGAGKLGQAGIPQPKPGAVTKANGGILFLDEIGELHPVQMNKLLKVLEDRKVFLESSYYSSEDKNIPSHIHEIFNNGLPADFRLIGATTKSPSDIPDALRSRCIEIYFRPLFPEEIGIIARKACQKSGLDIEERALEEIKRYASSGREAMNIVQIASGLAMTQNRRKIELGDIQWIAESGQYAPRADQRVGEAPAIGYVNGLGVFGPHIGTMIEVEASAVRVPGNRNGRIIITGIVEEEETNLPGRTLRRKSTASNSVENVLTALKKFLEVRPDDYDIHLNFPGGVPIDGPSAGIAIATAIYSAITEQFIDPTIAMTGEVSIRGNIKPVGGVPAKIEAARRAGCRSVLIPKENYQEQFKEFSIEVIPIEGIREAIEISLYKGMNRESKSNGNISEKHPFVAALGSNPPAKDTPQLKE